MQLQNFQPKARITGDKMDLRNYYGRPLLVRVNEFVPDFTSQRFPDPKPVVFVDVVDLMSGTIFINALWGGGAVVDNLREYAGTEVVLPLVANNATSSGGNNYIGLAALDDNTAAMAGQWAQTNWGVVEQTRQQRMAAAQAAAPAPAQGQFQQAGPVQQAPQQGFGQIGVQGQPAQIQQAPQQGFAPAAGQAPQQFQQAPARPQQGFGQPAPQQAAPAQNQWAPQQAAPAQPGMFSDAQPAMQAGQGFGAPQGGVDQAAAKAALQQLNGQLG